MPVDVEDNKIKGRVVFPSGEMEFFLAHHEDEGSQLQSLTLTCKSTYNSGWDVYGNMYDNLDVIANIMKELAGIEEDEDE